MQDIKDFENLLLVKDNTLLIYCKIRKAIYKIIFNKILRYISYTNKIIYGIINSILKQIRLLFEKYL